jgi:hypothetical protein
MKQRSWSRFLRSLAVVALAAAASLAVTGPAQAYTCSGGRSITVTGDVSKVSVTFYPECSDNLSHWSGTLYDTKCDGRSARAVLVANQAYGYWQWAHGYNAGNGCGTSSTFRGSDRSVIDYWGLSWVVEVSAGACNTWSCSSYAKGYLHN